MATPPTRAGKIIKRYANRKLYDTDRSCYVTLEEIAEMVKEGDDLRIIDNRTGEDLTSVTLTQIIYEDQKKPDQKGALPLGALRSIIQSGGEIFSKLTTPMSQMGDDLKRRASRYEGPYGGPRHRGYGEPHQPRTSHKDPSEEVTLQDLYALMVSMEQRIGRMERQLQRLGQQAADGRRRERKGRNPLQKSKPSLPL